MNLIEKENTHLAKLFKGVSFQSGDVLSLRKQDIIECCFNQSDSCFNQVKKEFVFTNSHLLLAKWNNISLT